MGISGGKDKNAEAVGAMDSAPPQKLKLVYFGGIPGRVEMTRQALTFLDVKFEDVNVTQEEWRAEGSELKKKYGQLPKLVFQIGREEHVMGQSFALLVYAAALGSGPSAGKLTPTNAQELFRAFAALFNLEDGISSHLGKAFGAADPVAAKKALVAEDGPWTKFAEKLDAQLGEAGSYIAGGMDPTFADFAYFASLEGLRAADQIPLFAGIPSDFLDKYPNIMAYRERIAGLRRLQEYYKNAEGPFAVFKPLTPPASEEGEAPAQPKASPESKISNTPPTKLELVYFGVPGRAELARLVFAIRGVEFEDVKLGFAEWPELKAKLGGSAQLPLLRLDGADSAASRMIGQSGAIALYAAKVGGAKKKAPELLPRGMTQARIIELMRDVEDQVMKAVVPYFGMQAQEEKDAFIAKITAEDGALTAGLKFLDQKVAGGYFIGGKLSLGDLIVFTTVYGPVGAGLIKREYVEGFANLKAHHDLIANHKDVKEYYKNAEGPWAAFKPVEPPAPAPAAAEEEKPKEAAEEKPAEEAKPAEEEKKEEAAEEKPAEAATEEKPAEEAKPAEEEKKEEAAEETPAEAAAEEKPAEEEKEEEAKEEAKEEAAAEAKPKPSAKPSGKKAGGKGSKRGKGKK